MPVVLCLPEYSSGFEAQDPDLRKVCL